MSVHSLLFEEIDALRLKLAERDLAYVKVTERIHEVGGYLDQITEMRLKLDASLADGKTKDEVIKKFRRAIGDHYAPEDCYATGPLTGNEFLDLVQCPACAAIAAYEELLSTTEPKL